MRRLPIVYTHREKLIPHMSARVNLEARQCITR